MKKNFFTKNASKIFIVLILAYMLLSGGALCQPLDCNSKIPGFGCMDTYFACYGGQCISFPSPDYQTWEDTMNELYHKKYGSGAPSGEIDVQRPDEYTPTAPEQPKKDVKLDSDTTDVTRGDAGKDGFIIEGAEY